MYTYLKKNFLFFSSKSSEIIKETVGLRPGRTEGVRVEMDEISLHNKKINVSY